jgi:hypothetical protein
MILLNVLCGGLQKHDLAHLSVASPATSSSTSLSTLISHTSSYAHVLRSIHTQLTQRLSEAAAAESHRLQQQSLHLLPSSSSSSAANSNSSEVVSRTSDIFTALVNVLLLQLQPSSTAPKSAAGEQQVIAVSDSVLHGVQRVIQCLPLTQPTASAGVSAGQKEVVRVLALFSSLL